MPAHLTVCEQSLLEKLTRARKSTIHVRAHVNRLRAARGIPPISVSTIARFFRGETHRRGMQEHRGRRKLLKRVDVRTMEQARLRLLKQAAKPGKIRRVTHEQVQEEAGLQDRCSSRTAQNALRAAGIRFRTPRRKVYLTARCT